MTKKRRSFSKQFKLDAVELVTKQGFKLSEAARNLDINVNLLTRWKKQLESDETGAFPGNGKMTSEKEELFKARKEIARLEMERDILKKAAVFFAKESD